MNSRIAIGTADSVLVCEHLARSSAFIVVEVKEGREVSRERRARGAGECGSHKSFVEMLEGCDAVICGGIGQGAYDSLAAHGIKAVVAAQRYGVDEALALYLAGSLPETSKRVCLCG